MTSQKSCHHKCAFLLTTRSCTSQLEAPMMKRCYNRTLTDFLCGRASGTWSSTPHIYRITGIGYIRRNIKTKNQTVRETAYNTLVRPQLEYAAPVWDPFKKDKRLQLENIQRRAARWTANYFDNRPSVTAMLDQLGLRSLEQRLFL